MGDLQADTSLWLGTRVARVLEFARTDPGWRCHGSPYLDTDHRNCACTKDREARAGALGLDHRWTLSIYAESDVCRGTSIMAGVGAVLWKPGRFSGMYRTAASCESRTCASGRTDFGSSIRSGLSYVQEAGAPLVGIAANRMKNRRCTAHRMHRTRISHGVCRDRRTGLECRSPSALRGLPVKKC